MITTTELEGLRAGIEAFNRGDVEGVLARLDPEIEVHAAPETGNSGTYYGHDGYRRWSKVWMEAWDEFELELGDIERVGEDSVVVETHAHGRGRGSGIDIEMDAYYLYTFRNGLCTRMHMYMDRESALRAARR